MVHTTKIENKKVKAATVDHGVRFSGLSDQIEEIRQQWDAAQREHAAECDYCSTGEVCQSMVDFRTECMARLRIAYRRQMLALSDQSLKATCEFCASCTRAQKNVPDCRSIGCGAVTAYDANYKKAILRLYTVVFDGEALFTPIPENATV